VGGEADPVAKIYGNRAGMLALRDQVDVALRADEGLASSAAYRETDERGYELFVLRAARCDGRAKGSGEAGQVDVHAGAGTHLPDPADGAGYKDRWLPLSPQCFTKDCATLG
jgi:hypothetical protein